MMEKPNLSFSIEIAGDDEAFQNSILEIIKTELISALIEKQLFCLLFTEIAEQTLDAVKQFGII